MSHLLQGVYSPLPQNISDSDSEKEISMEPICSNYPKHSSSPSRNGHMDYNNSLSDEVVKIKQMSKKMSKLRMLAFVFSILLCFIPIIIFLWILPCTDSMTCPMKVTNWEYQQEDIELKGKINLVHGVYKNNLNLAMMFRGKIQSSESYNYGVISFMGRTGNVAWIFKQDQEPIDMDCMMMDLNENGINDCLLIDKNGLKAIETVSGTTLWHLHSQELGSIVSDVGLPIKLADINRDGIIDLVAIYQKKRFLFVCGKSGKALKTLISSCNNMADMKRENTKITYACKNSTKVKYFELGVDEMIKAFQNENYNLQPNKIFRNTDEKVYVTGNRKLVITNIGQCPDCHSTVSLFDEKEKQLKTWPYYKTYIMKPEIFAFNSTETNLKSLKGHVQGFILKMWQWPDSNSKRLKRYAPVQNVTINEIMEKVTIISFNNSDIIVVNASLTAINQLCSGSKSEFCQPNLSNQENSALIADLDKDGSLELVSYTTTYLEREEKSSASSWHLVSHLKVFRLEGELPKLFERK